MRVLSSSTILYTAVGVISSSVYSPVIICSHVCASFFLCVCSHGQCSHSCKNTYELRQNIPIHAKKNDSSCVYGRAAIVWMSHHVICICRVVCYAPPVFWQDMPGNHTVTPSDTYISQNGGRASTRASDIHAAVEKNLRCGVDEQRQCQTYTSVFLCLYSCLCYTRGTKLFQRFSGNHTGLVLCWLCWCAFPATWCWLRPHPSSSGELHICGW